MLLHFMLRLSYCVGAADDWEPRGLIRRPPKRMERRPAPGPPTRSWTGCSGTASLYIPGRSDRRCDLSDRWCVRSDRGCTVSDRGCAVSDRGCAVSVRGCAVKQGVHVVQRGVVVTPTPLVRCSLPLCKICALRRRRSQGQW